MNDNIRVAYDTSVLGSGYINYRLRTGIFRVIEEMLVELNRRDNISVYPVALNKESTILDDTSSRLYFEQEKTELLKNFRATYCSQLHLDNTYTALVNFQKKLFRTATSRDHLAYKVGRALDIVGRQLVKAETFLSSRPSGYDVYHGSYFPLPDSDTLPDVPRILTVYDLIPLLFPEFVVPKVNQRAINLLQSINIQKDWIICISEHTKQDFCLYSGMDSERVFVAPLAAAGHFHPVKDSSHIQNVLSKYRIPQEPYLLSLCTLEPRKNLEMLIRAFSEFIQAHPDTDLNLVLVGTSGWKNSAIFQAAQDNSQIKNRIIFSGYVPDEDLAAIYSRALAFVYPSLYEGFGLPPLEAMQCGTPIIASCSSSLPEVVGDAGILFDPKHQSELSHAIWKLVNDSELHAQLSQKSLARAHQFSWSKCADKTIEVYRTALENRD